jgi:putative zinc finger protein
MRIPTSGHSGHSTVTNRVMDDRVPAPGEPIDSRAFVEQVWHAIGGLPPRQRGALLLGAGDPALGSAVPLLVECGVASLDEVAGAMELPPSALRRFWSTLPFDDLQIGAQFGITWVQASRLRATARAALAHAVSGVWRDLPPARDGFDRLAHLLRGLIDAAGETFHVERELLAAHLRGMLGEADREIVTGHLAICNACADVVRLLFNTPKADSATADTSGHRSFLWRVLRRR